MLASNIDIFSFVPDISSAHSAGATIVKLIESTPEIDAEHSSSKMIDRFSVRGQIRFENENVDFRHPSRPDVRVLRGLTFKVEPGTYVALVGASGCGKAWCASLFRIPRDDVSEDSCRIQLIERFYDPQRGRIFLDGNPIREYNVQEYRKQIALVSQEPVSPTE